MLCANSLATAAHYAQAAATERRYEQLFDRFRYPLLREWFADDPRQDALTEAERQTWIDFVIANLIDDIECEYGFRLDAIYFPVVDAGEATGNPEVLDYVHGACWEYLGHSHREKK